MPQVGPLDQSARGAEKIVSQATCNHHDSAARRTAGRLDDELGAVADHLQEPRALAVLGHHEIGFRHLDAVGLADFLGLELVIDARIKLARIVLENEIDVALVDSQDAPSMELFRPSPESFGIASIVVELSLATQSFSGL